MQFIISKKKYTIYDREQRQWLFISVIKLTISIKLYLFRFCSVSWWAREQCKGCVSLWASAQVYPI